MTKRTADVFLGIFMLLAVAALFFERRLRYPSNVFPYAVFILIVTLTVIIIVRSLLDKRSKRTEGAPSITWDMYKRVIIVAAASVVYVAAVATVGFYLSSFLFLVVLSLLLQPNDVGRNRRVMSSILMALVVCVVIYVLFAILLRVRTPGGILF